jgi:hypothetical protein
VSVPHLISSVYIKMVIVSVSCLCLCVCVCVRARTRVRVYLLVFQFLICLFHYYQIKAVFSFMGWSNSLIYFKIWVTTFINSCTWICRDYTFMYLVSIYKTVRITSSLIHKYFLHNYRKSPFLIFIYIL